MNAQPYVLGVDAGGTSTRCWAVALDGTLLGMGVGGPGNLYTIGVAGFVDRICEVAAAALGCYGAKAQVLCIGAAGIGRPAEVEQVRAALTQRELAHQLLIENDGYISLYAGTLGQPGVVVISGTGSIAVGINHRAERARAGGWGHLLGDEGSGYDVALQAVQAILRAHDGRGPSVSFALPMLAQLSLEQPEGLVQLFYKQSIGKEKVASLAPLVLNAVASDPVAANIVDNAARELASLGAAVRYRLQLPDSAPLVTAGGMFKHHTLKTAFQRALANVCPRVPVVELQWEAALGAVFLALRQAGAKYGWQEAAHVAAQIVGAKGV